jgi:hypothetical protein
VLIDRQTKTEDTIKEILTTYCATIRFRTANDLIITAYGRKKIGSSGSYSLRVIRDLDVFLATRVSYEQHHHEQPEGAWGLLHPARCFGMVKSR